MDYSSALAAIPQFAHLGPLFKSSSPVHLTEEETEYSIFGIKHIFPDHILLQFDCTNTVPEQVLENVVVLIDLAEAVRASLPSHPLRCYISCSSRESLHLPCGVAPHDLF